MSEMIKHLVMCYKYGMKQLYYFNTYDGSGEIDVDRMNQRQVLIESVEVTLQADDADCDACKI
jgi:ribonucleoside-diphosphate reductase alpha chain